MTTRLAVLDNEKQLLLTRSTLCRIRLRGDASYLRDRLHWKRILASTASAPAFRPLVFSLAVSVIGPARSLRWIAFASRIVLIASLVRTTVAWMREPEARAYGNVQTRPGRPL